MIPQVPCVNFKFSARWSFHIKKRWPDCKVNVRILRLISTRLGWLGYVMTTCNPLGKIIKILISHCNNWFHSMPWFWLHPPTTHFLIIHRVGLHAIHGKSNNGKDNALFMAVEENTASFWIMYFLTLTANEKFYHKFLLQKKLRTSLKISHLELHGVGT